MLEVFSPTLFEGLYTQFAAIFNDFYVPVANWEVLSFSHIWLFIIITLEFFRGKSANATVGLLVAHHQEVIFLNLVLFVLFDDQAQVFDLPLDWLAWRTWFNHLWRLAFLLWLLAIEILALMVTN